MTVERVTFDVEPQHALSTGELCFYTFVTSGAQFHRHLHSQTVCFVASQVKQNNQHIPLCSAEPTCLAGSIWYPLWKALSKSLYHSILRLRA